MSLEAMEDVTDVSALDSRYYVNNAEKAEFPSLYKLFEQLFDSLRWSPAPFNAEAATDQLYQLSAPYAGTAAETYCQKVILALTQTLASIDQSTTTTPAQKIAAKQAAFQIAEEKIGILGIALLSKTEAAIAALANGSTRTAALRAICNAAISNAPNADPNFTPLIVAAMLLGPGGIINAGLNPLLLQTFGTQGNEEAPMCQQRIEWALGQINPSWQAVIASITAPVEGTAESMIVAQTLGVAEPVTALQAQQAVLASVLTTYTPPSPQSCVVSWTLYKQQEDPLRALKDYAALIAGNRPFTLLFDGSEQNWLLAANLAALQEQCGCSAT